MPKELRDKKIREAQKDLESITNMTRQQQWLAEYGAHFAEVTAIAERINDMRMAGYGFVESCKKLQLPCEYVQRALISAAEYAEHAMKPPALLQ